MSKMKWTLHQQTRVYDGHFKVDKLQLSHDKFAGGSCDYVQRELVHRANTVAVLPYDPVQDKVIIIEQFRVGAIHLTTPWLQEIVAGLQEQDEDPVHTAARECLEETGCQVMELMPISQFYTSPGGLAEWVQLYVARVCVDDHKAYAGLQQESEDIRVCAVELDDIPELLAKGKICSAIAIISLQWLLANKQSLQQCWMATAGSPDQRLK